MPGEFAGKVFLLTAAIDGGMAWLAVFAAGDMAVGLFYVGLFYYVRVIAEMYFKAPRRAGHRRRRLHGWARPERRGDACFRGCPSRRTVAQQLRSVTALNGDLDISAPGRLEVLRGSLTPCT